MIITNFSVKHRVAVFVLIAGIALLGTFSYLTLPRESSPDIKVPLVTVAVPWPEASPEDVESSVTVPLEREGNYHFLTARHQDASLRFVLDTGSQQSLLDSGTR